MNHIQVIQDVTGVIRQFNASETGCSAGEIALAEKIPLDRCIHLLARLKNARVIELVDTTVEPRFCLAETVTALDVLKAAWSAKNKSTFELLFATSASSSGFVKDCSRGQWAQG